MVSSRIFQTTLGPDPQWCYVSASGGQWDLSSEARWGGGLHALDTSALLQEHQHPLEPDDGESQPGITSYPSSGEWSHLQSETSQLTCTQLLAGAQVWGVPRTGTSSLLHQLRLHKQPSSVGMTFQSVV